MAEKKSRRKRGQRKDGRIQVTYTDGYREDGKPNRISFYGRTRAEAERKRDEYKTHGKQRLSGDDITVSEWIEQYKAIYRQNVNPAYIQNDDIPYNRLCAAVGDLPLSAVRESDLQSALNRLAGMSDSSIQKYKQAMKRVFLRAVKNGLIAKNPAEDLMTPSGTSGTHRALERWESDCILQNWRNHRAGIWAMLMMLAGLRRGELMALRWENVDMFNHTLTVCEVAVVAGGDVHIENRAKSEAGIRTIPLCSALFNALNETPSDQRHGLICTTKDGKLNTQSSFKYAWKSFCEALQINVRAHDLRHTFATALFDAGIPAKAAQYYLGHANINITLGLYTHLSSERQKTSNSQLVGFLDGWVRNPDSSTEKMP